MTETDAWRPNTSVVGPAVSRRKGKSFGAQTELFSIDVARASDQSTE